MWLLKDLHTCNTLSLLVLTKKMIILRIVFSFTLKYIKKNMIHRYFIDQYNENMSFAFNSDQYSVIVTHDAT